jgi:hypothetical protein
MPAITMQLLFLFLMPHLTLLLPHFMQNLPYLTMPLHQFLQFVQILSMLLQSSSWLCFMPRISMLLQPTQVNTAHLGRRCPCKRPP